MGWIYYLGRNVPLHVPVCWVPLMVTVHGMPLIDIGVGGGFGAFVGVGGATLGFGAGGPEVPGAVNDHMAGSRTHHEPPYQLVPLNTTV